MLVCGCATGYRIRYISVCVQITATAPPLLSITRDLNLEYAHGRPASRNGRYAGFSGGPRMRRHPEPQTGTRDVGTTVRELGRGMSRGERGFG